MSLQRLTIPNKTWDDWRVPVYRFLKNASHYECSSWRVVEAPWTCGKLHKCPEPLQLARLSTFSNNESVSSTPCVLAGFVQVLKQEIQGLWRTLKPPLDDNRGLLQELKLFFFLCIESQPSQSTPHIGFHKKKRHNSKLLVLHTKKFMMIALANVKCNFVHIARGITEQKTVLFRT